MAKAVKSGGTLSGGKARASPVPSRPVSPAGKGLGGGPSSQAQAKASTSQLKQPKPKQKPKPAPRQQQSPASAAPDRTGSVLKIDLQLWTTLVRPTHKTAYDWIQRNLTLFALSTSALARDPGGLKLHELTSRNGKKHLFIGGGESDSGGVGVGSLNDRLTIPRLDL